MIKKTQFRINQSTQPISTVTVKKETPEERFARLKRTADVTGKRFVQVYLEDERRRQQGNQG